MKRAGGSKQNLYAQVNAGFAGYWPDEQTIDRVAVEQKRCPECRAKKLEYRAFSNATSYRAFGVCDECEVALLVAAEYCAPAVRQAREKAATESHAGAH